MPKLYNDSPTIVIVPPISAAAIIGHAVECNTSTLNAATIGSNAAK